MLCAYIAQKERLSPAQSAQDPDRKWISRAIKQLKPGEADTCRKEWLAYKLAIPTKALDHSINPGFAKFAKQVHLARYLAIFDHQLQVDRDHRISLLCQNVMQPWASVKAEAQQQPRSYSEFPRLYNPPFKYGKEGIQTATFYQWKTLEPFKIEHPPSWGKEYRFEICTLCTGKFRPLGDHTWMRLKTPKGEIYSFGPYREDNDFRTACAWKRCFIQSPDISEFWDEPIHTLSFTITKGQFDKIKKKVEKDQKESLEFHIFRSNCAEYAVSCANLIGIPIGAKMSFARNLLPENIRRFGISMMRHIPRPIRKVIHLGGRALHHLVAVPLNLVSCVLGNKISSLFDHSTISYTAPYKLAYEPNLPSGVRCVRSTT